MAVSPGYRDHLLDLLEPLGPVTARRMFGGLGIFYADVMFGLVVEDGLHLKVDEATRPAFEAAGSGPFTYLRSGQPRALKSYWRVPDEIMDTEDDLRAWARAAVDVALSAQKAKAPAKVRGTKSARQP